MYSSLTNSLKTQTILAIMVPVLIALTALSASTTPADDKKEKKDAPRKIEIAADEGKVRAALIKIETDEGCDLGHEQANRVVFRHRPGTGFVHVFTFATDAGSTTVYATTQFCLPSGSDNCQVRMNKTFAAQLDKLLESVKTAVEGK